jgi:hypothetical protein
MTSRPDDVAAYLAEYPESVCEIATGLRKLIRATLPGANEMLDRPGHVVGYGFGAGYKELICTIILSKSGVKLGIVNGATLPDPKGLLEGAGKRHKYVVLSAPSDLRRPGLAPLLESAATAVAARGK